MSAMHHLIKMLNCD